jgi:hypothetical protein
VLMTDLESLCRALGRWAFDGCEFRRVNEPPSTRHQPHATHRRQLRSLVKVNEVWPDIQLPLGAMMGTAGRALPSLIGRAEPRSSPVVGTRLEPELTSNQ